MTMAATLIPSILRQPGLLIPFAAMATLDDLETPAVLVDLDVLERNVAGVAAWARQAGVRLRPHVKSHKTLEIARLQVQAGADGLTVAKVSEAEVYAEAGFTDLFLAYPVVGVGKPERLLALSARARLTVGVDSEEGAAALSRTFAAAGQRLRTRLKVDVGFHRAGVSPDGALDLARRVAALPGLELAGLFTHAGQCYHQACWEDVCYSGRREGEALVAVAEALRQAGLPADEVSVGATPTARSAMFVPGVTEARPGTYVFYDATQVSLGACGLEDCAMTVLATVVSAPAPDRAVVDAGSKTLSSDPLRPTPDGHGLVVAPARRSRLRRLSEEHGVIAVEPGESFRVGDRLRIVPNHACVVSNLHDRLFAVRGREVVGELPVRARGCVR
jgi:D-serine deaminase-like pyridoxal phosphate-dependent protein